jgi:hypothetical protein
VDWLVEANVSEKCVVSIFRALDGEYQQKQKIFRIPVNEFVLQ